MNTHTSNKVNKENQVFINIALFVHECSIWACGLALKNASCNDVYIKIICQRMWERGWDWAPPNSMERKIDAAQVEVRDFSSNSFNSFHLPANGSPLLHCFVNFTASLVLSFAITAQFPPAFKCDGYAIFHILFTPNKYTKHTADTLSVVRISRAGHPRTSDQSLRWSIGAHKEVSTCVHENLIPYLLAFFLLLSTDLVVAIITQNVLEKNERQRPLYSCKLLRGATVR